MTTDDHQKKPRRGLAAAPEKAVIKTTAGSKKAQKIAARLAAVQVLYQMELNNQDGASAVAEFIKHRVGFNFEGDVFVPADPELLETIVMGVVARWSDIADMMTAALAQGGKTEVETLLTAVLQAGIWELLENTSVDTGVIINDYMNVTNSFYEGSETKLVNAILDKIAKTVRE